MSTTVLVVLMGALAPGALAQPTSYVSPNPQPNGGFGAAVTGVGDLDGDGTPDVLVGAPGERIGSEEGAGRAYVFSGTSGTLLHTLTAPDPTVEQSFGRAVAPVGDVTGDGVPEVAIGATGPNGASRVYRFSLP